MPRTAPSLRSIRPAPKQVLRAAGAAAGDEPMARRIAESITAAIVERRLMPGTKLAEQKIADIFKVSRTLVRQALHLLGHDKLITLEKGRGARVAEPSVEEAQHVFEVRRMLEAALVQRAAAELAPAHIAALRAHLTREQAAVARGDVAGRTRLLADFHVLLAGLLGNPTLAALMRDLLSRSALISLMYQSALSAEQSCAEHAAIVDAIERGDGAAASHLMGEHLAHVEHHLKSLPRVAALRSVPRP